MKRKINSVIISLVVCVITLITIVSSISFSSIYEKNEKLGKKLFITGKGRCNITNAGDMEDLFDHVVSNPKFLYKLWHKRLRGKNHPTIL